MSSPFISIIIPCFNAEDCLERSVRSVINQTFQDFEIIIINDASTDSSLKKAKTLAYTDSRIKIINLKTNGGPSIARNTGIKEAKGEWISILDADDAFMPERLEVLTSHITNSNLDIIADNQYFYDSFAKKISRQAMLINNVKTWNFRSHLLNDKSNKLFKWGLLKPLIKKSFLIDNNISYQNQFRVGEDSLLYMEILIHGAKGLVIPRPMYIYTTSFGEISRMSSGLSSTRYISNIGNARLDYFKEKYATKLTQQDKKVLTAYTKMTDADEKVRLFKMHLKKCRIINCVKLIIQNPQILSMLRLSIWKLIRTKYGRTFFNLFGIKYR